MCKKAVPLAGPPHPASAGEEAGCGGPGLLWLHGYGCEINIKLTNLHIFLQSASQLHPPSKPASSVALCPVITLQNVERPLLLPSEDTAVQQPRY